MNTTVKVTAGAGAPGVPTKTLVGNAHHDTIIVSYGTSVTAKRSYARTDSMSAAKCVRLVWASKTAKLPVGFIPRGKVEVSTDVDTLAKVLGCPPEHRSVFAEHLRQAQEDAALMAERRARYLQEREHRAIRKAAQAAQWDKLRKELGF